MCILLIGKKKKIQNLRKGQDREQEGGIKSGGVE